MQVAALSSAAVARQFYEQRYAQGYMDFWDGDKLARVAEVVRGLDLPAGARVLDFGCGSGVFTALLRDLLPGCEVHGCDVSENAVTHAQSRHGASGIAFALLDDAFLEEHVAAFELVFSHHVLEHVFDLERTAADVARIVAPGGRMLHALPCGNAGSLHHWICRCYPEGIDGAQGGRFFFEEASHLRRLTTEGLVAAFAPHGFRLGAEAYAYQHWGAVRLITESSPAMVLELFDPRRCHRRRAPAVALWLSAMLLLWALRAPVLVLGRCRRMLVQCLKYRTRRPLAGRSLLLLGLAVPALVLWLPSALVDAAVRWADRREWRKRRGDRRGSEMMVVLQRAADPISRHHDPRPPRHVLHLQPHR